MATAVLAGLATAASTIIAKGLTWAAFKAFAIGAGLSLVSQALMPKPDLGSQMGGRSVTAREPAHSRKIVYGRSRVGGNIVYLESTGTDNKYLWLVIAVAGHEIDAYEEVWFNDEKIWDGGSFVGSWGSYVSIGFHKGDQTTSDSALTAASTKWTSDHKLLDTAYMVVKLTYDVDQFANGLPNISTVIRGKKVLNPATSTTAWSQNPALCVYDYLRDTKYGLGESASNILTSSVTAAAAVCDENVSLAAGGTQKRYTIDGMVDTAGSVKSNMDAMLGSMIGRLVFSAGKFEIYAGEYVAPTYSVDESVAVGDISVQTKQSRRNAYNGVKGVFVSQEDNFILADYPAQISSTYATQDGDPIYLDMPLPFTVNNIRAQRIAKLALFRSRQQEAITIPCNLSALRFKIGDNINVTNARLGYSNKVFEVVGYEIDFTTDGRIVVNVDAIETASSIWDWNTSDEEVYLGAGEVDIYDGLTASAPTNLSVTGDSFLNSDGTFNAEFNVAWTDADDAFTDHYVVEWKLASASNYYSMTTKSSPAVITSLQNGQTYNVRVKAINEIGVSSAYIASSPTAATDTTAPSVPTSLSATGQFEAVSVNWTNPTQSDFSHVDVYQSTSSTGTYTLIGKSSGTSFLSVGLSTTTTYYFKVKAVDFTGNQSGFSSVASATTVAAPASNVVTTTRMTSSTSTAAPSNAAFAAFVGRNPINGDIVYVTYTGVTPNTQKVYLRVSGAWVEQTNIISGEVITNGSVDTSEIADDAITADKILAGSVTAGKITVTDLAEINPDLGTVTGGDLSGVTITSTKMYQGTGTFNNANTGFYLDNSGQFSLKDKLSFNGATLAVDGDITAVNLDVTNATVSGSFVAANLPNLQNMNGSITGSQLDSTAKFPSFFKYTRTSGTSVAAPTDTEFNTEFGRDPLENDQLIVTNTAPDPDTQAAYVRGASSWSTSANFLSGSLIVDGTVGANQIVANAVTADKINVTDLAAISADLGSITAGALNINNAFTVTSAGVMTATGATVTGDITANSGSIASTVTIGGTTASTVVAGASDGASALQDSDTNVNLGLTGGTISGITISGTKLYEGAGTFNNANTGFYLDNAGQFSLKDKLSFNGTTLSVDGNITANNLNIQNATVTGTLSANNIKIDGVSLDTNAQGELTVHDLGITSDLISTGAVSASKIIAHATSMVNPVSATGNVYRYGGYDDAGNIVNSIPSGITVSYNGSDKALAIANAGNSSVRTDSFPIDSNSVYKITLQIRKTSAGGKWYVGANQYTSFTNGSTSTNNGATAISFGRYDSSRVAQTAASNVYFAWNTSVSDTNYDTVVCYFLGADVDIDEVPNHFIESGLGSGPYVRFNSTATHGGLRILNWENGSTNRTLLVKNITVQRMTANSIVADNISATNLAAINSDLGAITAGSLNINNVFTVTSAGVMTATSGAIGSSVTIGGTTASTVVSGAADGATAVQDGDTSVDLSLNAGAVGGVTISGTTLYQGTGTFNNSNTGFYLDNLGRFSLKDKLSFDGTTLDIDGDITAQNLDVTNATVSGSFVANNLPNLQNMNGNITANQISANEITVDKLSGDVSELYPTSVYTQKTLTGSSVFVQQFYLPAPELGLSKRQRVDLGFDFTVQNTSSTDYQVAWYVGLQIVSKGATGTQVGSTGGVVSSSFPFSYQQWIYISGNHLAALDNTGAVANNSSGSGFGQINSVFYHSYLNRTYIMVSALSAVFTTGDTLFFNPYHFASTGTYVTTGGQEYIQKWVPANTTQSVRHTVSDTYGASTTTTEFRPVLTGSSNITNVTCRLKKFSGTMENVS